MTGLPARDASTIAGMSGLGLIEREAEATPIIDESWMTCDWPGCGAAAQWKQVMSCGHEWLYCADHKTRRDEPGAQGNIDCAGKDGLHAPHPVTWSWHRLPRA